MNASVWVLGLLSWTGCEYVERAQDALKEFEQGPDDYVPAASRHSPRIAEGGDSEANHDRTQLGTLASAQHFSLRALGIQPCQLAPDDELDPAEALIGIEVELTAHANEGVPVNTFYAELEDADGRRFKPEHRGCTPALRAQPVRRDERARGFITFRVPRAATGLSLHYSPRLRDGRTDAVRIPLHL